MQKSFEPQTSIHTFKSAIHLPMHRYGLSYHDPTMNVQHVKWATEYLDEVGYASFFFFFFIRKEKMFLTNVKDMFVVDVMEKCKRSKNVSPKIVIDKEYCAVICFSVYELTLFSNVLEKRFLEDDRTAHQILKTIEDEISSEVFF